MIKLTLFSQLVQLLPRQKFNKLVVERKADKYQKGLDTWTHLICMLFCHLGHACSLRDISNGMRSITGNLNHLGIKRAPSKSSLSYHNAHQDWRLFRDFYYVLLKELHQRHSFSRKGLPRLKRKVFLLDASLVPLCLSLFDWAKFRTAKGAVKLHLLLDYDGCLPVFAHLTNGKVHEVNVAKTLVFPTGSVVVFDRAYVDYEWLRDLDSKKVIFVSRAKSNMAYRVNKHRPYDKKKHPSVLQDSYITLTGPQAKKLKGKPLRLVRILDSTTGKRLTFITNEKSWDAHLVAQVYKERWNIEIFFKQIKQQLHIKSFIGTSENAVQIQIWTAMIAMLLLNFLKEKAQYCWHLSNLATFIRLNLFVKIALFQWINKPFFEGKTTGSNQILLFSG